MSAIDQYFGNAIRLLGEAGAGKAGDLELAAQKIAECVGNGGMLYAFGTGHAHILAEEIFYRAGGMAPVYPILDDRLMLHVHAGESTQLERQENMAEELLGRYPIGKGDVLLVMSNSGRNAAPVNMALLARERGAYVIALTSLTHSRASSPRNQAGKRLYEVCDLALDNLGVEGDAAIDVGDGRRVGATSTVVGAAILEAVICRVKEIALEKGMKVDFFLSSNVDGGDAVNDALIAKYGAVIHCL